MMTFRSFSSFPPALVLADERAIAPHIRGDGTLAALRSLLGRCYSLSFEGEKSFSLFGMPIERQTLTLFMPCSIDGQVDGE